MHTLAPDGAGYKYKRDILIGAKNARPYDAKAEDQRDNWFRPSDVAIGTDGAVYISDWYDPMVGGHDLKEKDGQGRILRVARRGSWARPVKVGLGTIERQLDALDNPAINVRYQAAMGLRQRGDAALPRLVRMLAERDKPRRRARAVWLLAQMGDRGAAAVENALNDPDENIRITAIRALRQVDHRVLDHLAERAGDTSSAVRREVAIALRDVPFDQAKPILLALAEGIDGKDRCAVEAFGIGCDGKEEQIYPELIDRLDARDPLNWSEATAAIAWRLHPRAAIDALAQRARAFSLTPEQRDKAVTAIAFIKDPRAAEAMVRLSSFAPDEVRAAAKWWLGHHADSDWSDFAAAKPFATTQPGADALKRLDADKKAMLDENASAKQRAKAAMKLATDAEGGKFILSLAAEGKFPKDLVAHVSEPIYHNPDFGVRALASEYFPRTTSAGAKLPPMNELVAMKGDAGRGRHVFFSATAGCARCHSFAREGREVGPDLTSIRTKYARRELLDSILNPSAAILMGYESWIFKTKSNQVYSGFILADAENVIIKESSGERVTIPAADIVLRKKQNLSVMPGNVALGLSAQELADLADFLMNSPAP
jgi:putative heme-binding domain-containing protein